MGKKASKKPQHSLKYAAGGAVGGAGAFKHYDNKLQGYVKKHGSRKGVDKFSFEHPHVSHAIIPKTKKEAHRMGNRGETAHYVHAASRFALVPAVAKTTVSRVLKLPHANKVVSTLSGVNSARYVSKVANARRGLYRYEPPAKKKFFSRNKSNTNESVSGSGSMNAVHKPPVKITPGQRRTKQSGMDRKADEFANRGTPGPTGQGQKTSQGSGSRQEGVLVFRDRMLLEKEVFNAIQEQEKEESGVKKAGRFTAGLIGGAAGAAAGSVVAPVAGSIAGGIAGDEVGTRTFNKVFGGPSKKDEKDVNPGDKNKKPAKKPVVS